MPPFDDLSMPDLESLTDYVMAIPKVEKWPSRLGRVYWPQLRPVKMRVLFAVVLSLATLAAQQPAAPKFDVVSIRAVPPNAPPVMRDIDFTPVLPGGQYVDSRTGLLFLIAFAYDAKGSLDRQLVGLPKWANEQSYAVSAKPSPAFPELPPNDNREQVRLMVRAMLENRFHLQLHTEIRQDRIFKLEVAKGGMKLKEVAPPRAAGEGRLCRSGNGIRRRYPYDRHEVDHGRSRDRTDRGHEPAGWSTKPG